jgi:hypothetical protein
MQQRETHLSFVLRASYAVDDLSALFNLIG